MVQYTKWCPTGFSFRTIVICNINDIDEVVNNKLLKFADDTKFFLNKVNSVEEVENLRTDLRSIMVQGVANAI